MELEPDLMIADGPVVLLLTRASYQDIMCAYHRIACLVETYAMLTEKESPDETR